ncbi:MAG: VCBS repeat-containing protein [Verrucomicrobiales bacterium]|nr:VCBS repeat-containing protein [Verrucomicrobiales bacterium]
MEQIMEMKGVARLTADERQDVLHFYLSFGPNRLPLLAEDPEPARSPVEFKSSVLGNPKSADSQEHPILGHVQIVDLNQDGHPDVLVCDAGESRVTWIHRTQGAWQEQTVAELPCPTHTQVVTNTSHGRLDVVVACQQVIAPTDDPVGSVVLLINDREDHFKPLTILDGISRVADVEPGDFDGDGDGDFVVGAYGFIKAGEVGWLENQSDNKYLYHTILRRTGAINVLSIDIDRDRRLDFVALFAQEHEQISAFLNRGNGEFQERELFKAATPSFGSSGLQFADLDRDGDMDILYTNGDNMDLPTMIPRPYHGVQWLENRGNLNFVCHDISRFYGAYGAAVGDLDNDGDLDLVLTSMFNDWEDRKRASIVWLENDGAQHFTPHGIARQPIQLISAAVGDLDGDAWLDVVACGMHAFPPFDRMGRITLWKNGRAHTAARRQ